MTETQTTPLFADLSDNNASFSAGAYRDAGHVVVAIKATEGVTYVDPEHRPWCLDAGARRVAVVHYHFARPDLGDTPEQEADHFLEVALPLAGGRDYLALDLERAAPAGWQHDPAWSKAFDQRVQSRSRFHVILYANRSTLAATPDAAAWLAGGKLRFWDADWTDAQDYAPPPGVVAIRQQSGVTAGKPPYSLPGCGPCDVDVARGAFWRAVNEKAR